MQVIFVLLALIFKQYAQRVLIVKLDLRFVNLVLLDLIVLKDLLHPLNV